MIDRVKRRPILDDKGNEIGDEKRDKNGVLQSVSLNSGKPGDVVIMPNGDRIVLQRLSPESDAII